jgi:hypothetical protein
MITFILYILATIGLTNILVHGAIFDLIKIQKKSLREWAEKLMGSYFKLFECYECTGFWAGLIFGYLLISPQWWAILACGFAGSVLAQTYTDWIYVLRSKVGFEVDDETTRDN